MKINSMFTWAIGAVLLVGATVGVMTASGQKAASTPSGPKLSVAAMDTDHDGTVSKEEFLVYMQAQFEKADTDHDGTLDAKEFAQLRKNLATATRQ